MNCKDFEEHWTLYLYDELSVEEAAAWEQHQAVCGACRGRYEAAKQLHQILSGIPQLEPALELLVQCRQALDEALDREELGWRSMMRGWVAGLTVSHTSAALAMLTLVLFGFGLGWTLRSRTRHLLTRATLPVATSSVNDFTNSRIRDITQVTPNPQTGEVRITLDAQRRVTLEGSLDDPRIEQVLVYALKNYGNPGIRRDTLDALRARRDHPNIRGALLYAIRHDSNPGVRLEALEATQGMEWCPELRQTLLESMKYDQNEGVRITALNVLVQHADESMLPALHQLAAQDPSGYVRLKSGIAIQELADHAF